MRPVTRTGMDTRTCVVGLGQSAAGDDGVGFAVLDELRRRCLPHGAELLSLSDAMDLVPLFEEGARVVLVDAVLARPAGRVMELGPEELSHRAPQAVSSHGIGAAQAIELAQTLAPCAATSHIRIVAVSIQRPNRRFIGLSPEVAKAVPRAADHVLSLLGGCTKEADHVCRYSG